MYESDDLSDSAEAVNLKRQRTMSYLQRQLELLPPPPDGLNEEQRERLTAIYRRIIEELEGELAAHPFDLVQQGV